MTRGGVEYNLRKTPYIVNLAGFTFFFSSQLYVDKFCNKVDEQQHKMEERFSSIMGVPLDISEAVSAVFAYYLVEKRGFLVYDIALKKYYENIYDFKFSLEVL